MFQNQGQSLVGILSVPAGSAAPQAALITLHGWSGYRIGPHAICVDLCRRAAAAGYACLRFDFRGRGDSEGDLEQAKRATMIEDAVAAATFVRERTGCRKLVLAGICAGSQVAIGALSAGANADGMMVWSAPVSEQAEEEKAVVAKRKHFLGVYARKLFQVQTWKKLITGKLQPRKIAKVMSGEAGRAAEDDRTTDLRAAARLPEFAGPTLFIYGTHDPVTPVALPYYQKILEPRKDRMSVHIVEGANHSYYGTAWREEVLSRSLAWLQDQFPNR